MTTNAIAEQIKLILPARRPANLMAAQGDFLTALADLHIDLERETRFSNWGDAGFRYGFSDGSALNAEPASDGEIEWLVS